MSFNDWQFQRTSLNMSLKGPAEGSAITNSSLSNPLVDSGTYCRMFGPSRRGTSSVTEDRSHAMYKFSLANYANIANNHAISIRAKIRMEDFVFADDTSSETYNQYIGIGSYFPIFTGTNLDSTTSTASLGYGIGLQAYYAGQGNGISPLVRLIMLADDNSGTVFADVMNNSNYAVVLTCPGTYTLGTWYHIRLDVIPNSITSAILKGYTSIDNGNSWLQVGEYLVNEGKFKTQGNNGIISKVNPSILQSSWQELNARMYVDDFKINTELVL